MPSARPDPILVAMQTVLRILTWLASVAFGALAVVIGILPETGQQLLERYRDHLADPSGRIASIAAGSVLLLVPAAILLRWYAGRRYAREISYTTENGRVAVSLIAIEEALTRAIEQEEVVRKVQVRVYEDRVKRAVVVEAALTLWDDGDVSSVNLRCQQLMRQRFAELMPEQDAVQVHLVVHRLSHRRTDEGHTESGQRDGTKGAKGKDRSKTKDSDRATKVTDLDKPEDPTPARVPLPGLTATQGSVDVTAGAELLRQRRETRPERDEDDRKTTTLQSQVGEQPKPPAEQAAELAATETEKPANEDELYDDLYLGPNYPVDDDDEDSGLQIQP